MCGRRTPSSVLRVAVDRRGERVRPGSLGPLDFERLPDRVLPAVAGSESSGSSAGPTEAGTAAAGELVLASRGLGEESRLAQDGSVDCCGMRRLRPAGCAERTFHPDNLGSGCSVGTASHLTRSAWAIGIWRESMKDLLTHIVQNGRRRATSGDGWPEGGTMDTSRGHDGPVNSRDDRQLRSVLGRHIMIWRQTWRQMWRPSKRHHQPIDTTRDRDARPARSVADGGLAFSAAATVAASVNGSGCSHTGEGAPRRIATMILSAVASLRRSKRARWIPIVVPLSAWLRTEVTS
jgi:hypothetical protein